MRVRVPELRVFHLWYPLSTSAGGLTDFSGVQVWVSDSQEKVHFQETLVCRKRAWSSGQSVVVLKVLLVLLGHGLVPFWALKPSCPPWPRFPVDLVSGVKSEVMSSSAGFLAL